MLRLIYFAPVTWASYAQRPHFLVRHLLDRGVVSEVLWVEPYPTRLPRWDDVMRRSGVSRRVHPIVPGVRCLGIRALPIEPLPGGWAVNRQFVSRAALTALAQYSEAAPCAIGVGRPSALAAWALDSLAHRRSFFDAMDDFPAFYGPVSGRAMARREQAVARRVDWVFCSSRPLLGKFEQVAKRVMHVPNGYPMDSLPEPAPVGTRDAVGYVGSIARWFDWGLVAEIAAALPDVPVQLIGPEFVGRPRGLPRNIEVLPECSREEAVMRIREFAVGLIPFHLSRLTASVDPIKYYEYRALGVAVWSTAFGEMAWRGGESGVRWIAGGMDWPALYGEVVSQPIDQAAVADFRRKNDWTKRFEVVAQCLAQ